jgi:hypothetical protein
MIRSEFIIRTLSPNPPAHRACAKIRAGCVYAMPSGINAAIRLLLAWYARKAQNGSLTTGAPAAGEAEKSSHPAG